MPIAVFSNFCESKSNTIILLYFFSLSIQHIIICYHYGIPVTDEGLTCAMAGALCHNQASCVDYEQGDMCCICKQGYFGNGITCMKESKTGYNYCVNVTNNIVHNQALIYYFMCIMQFYNFGPQIYVSNVLLQC